MNANELADYLLNFIMTVEDYDESKHEKAATMLRQQQERIKQLEETQEYLYKTHDADKAQIEALKRPNNVVGVPADKLAEMQAEIEALKAGKIRAYDNGVEDGRKPNTNLVKELTDAEIWSISAKHGDLSWHDHTLNFARAIIKEVCGK